MLSTILRNRLCTAVLASLGLAAAQLSIAQQFPSKPVTIVVPAGPGGPADIVARTLAPAMGKELGQSVIVENRASAGGLVGYEYVAKGAPADGHTISIAGDSLFLLPLFLKDLRFTPIEDLRPFVLLGQYTLVLASPTVAPWNDYRSFVAHAKANPGKVFLGGQGGTRAVLQAEILNQKEGIELTFVNYKGGLTQSRQAMIANEIQLTYLDGGSALTDFKAGKVRLLAILGKRRLEQVPDVPTFAELGIPGVPGEITLAMNVRSGTPAPVVTRLNEAVIAALQQPMVKETMTRLQYQVMGSTAEAAVKLMSESYAFWKGIAEKARIQPQ